MILAELNDRKYGCLMAFPSQDLAAKIQEIVKVIEERLGSALKEAEPDSHVTVLWGLSDDDPTPIKKLFGTQEPISATLGEIEKFANDGEDVIHISVKSPILYELNKKAKTLPHKESEFDYHPHLTLAYVEPGSCDGLLGWNPGFGTVTFDKLIFSSSTKEKTTIADLSTQGD